MIHTTFSPTLFFPASLYFCGGNAFVPYLFHFVSCLFSKRLLLPAFHLADRFAPVVFDSFYDSPRYRQWLDCTVAHSEMIIA
ncbi:hypothetical protein ASPVEDRAFT_642062 [Aspergillus versicolor CBS 583.65]|uniref:Uncharacterized protein n=1 Tax=Aspergillus versicolor CBS 583.65 TaxID=1036611 RepID=A0A1L9PJ97_ASPVE|nr:uncharacterized protein ASPVEDRAFT_642062 [Aspergillus versicolor CBS 583.65]OJJ01561.1 hypothetical protein ASPVEDRAFT_642062 [Aspergillus versicolor CBS 583.65]